MERRRGACQRAASPFRLAVAIGMTGLLLAGCGIGDDSAAPAPPPATALPASVAISAPTRAEPGLAAALGSDVAASATGLRLTWQFDDGSTANGAQVSHAWAKPGTYQLSLTVSNEAGASSVVKRSITVGRFAMVADAACSGGNGQGWCWQRPRPTGNTINDQVFVGSQRVWAVGDAGQILHSRDAGQHWTQQVSGVTARLTQVRFADALNGWALGIDGTLLHTADGGATWQAQASGIYGYCGGGSIRVLDVRSAVLIPACEAARYTTDAGQTWLTAASVPGWLTGDGTWWQARADGVAKSTDRGQTYAVVLPMEPGMSLTGVEFSSGLDGWAWGYDYNNAPPPNYLPAPLVWVTHDGGNTWRRNTVTGLPLFDNLNLLQFSGGVGWARYAGQLYRSTDDLASWSQVPPPAEIGVGYFYVSDVKVTDANTAWMQVNGMFYLTRDGGAHWLPIKSPAAEQASYSYSQTLLTAGDGALWGRYDGRSYRSTDNGATWQQILGGDAADAAAVLSALWFFDSGKGLAVSARGWLVETPDSGLTWVRRQLAPITSYRNTPARLQFADADNGWLMLADGSAIHRSSDGGRTWSAPLSPTGFSGLADFQFLDAQRGWAVQSDGSLFSSADAGATWQPLGTLPFTVNALRFANDQLGIAVGDNGQVARTTDGGSTWRLRASLSTGSFKRVVFADASTAWAVGSAGAVIRSDDAGLTWAPGAVPSVADLNDITFSDRQHGWMVGASGTILSTEDGGRTWLPQPSGTVADLFSIFASDARTAWIAGSGGVVLATATGGQ